MTRDSFRTVDFPGTNDTFALGINASGQIVGLYADSAGVFHSFLAVPGQDDGQKIAPNTASSPLSTPRPTCGSDEWKEHVKRWRDARCQISH